MIECYMKDYCGEFARNKCARSGDELMTCQKYFSLDRLYDKALLSNTQRLTRKLKLTADEIDIEAYKQLSLIKSNIKLFVQSGKNIYLYSSTTGNGKTSWALKLLQAYLDSVWIGSSDRCRALFIDVPKFLMSLKDNISEKNQYVHDVKANVLNADLVVWDDIATKNISAYEQETLLGMINNRIESGKSNIYTANIVPEQLEQYLGARLSSRIRGSKQFMLRAPDMRGMIY